MDSSVAPWRLARAVQPGGEVLLPIVVSSRVFKSRRRRWEDGHGEAPVDISSPPVRTPWKTQGKHRGVRTCRFGTFRVVFERPGCRLNRQYDRYFAVFGVVPCSFGEDQGDGSGRSLGHGGMIAPAILAYGVV